MSDQPGYIYLLVPPHLAQEALTPLRQHFASDPLVEVIVERRTSTMRSGIDNVILRDVDDLHRSERRAQTIPRGLPPLPPHLAVYAPQLQIRHRLQAVRSGLHDLTIEDVVTRAKNGEPDAHTELMWRSSERVYRRVGLHVNEQQQVEEVVKATFGHIFDTLHDFDPEASSFNSWLDRKTDEHVLRQPPG